MRNLHLRRGRPKKNPLTRREQMRAAQTAFRKNLRASGFVVIRAIVEKDTSARLERLIGGSLRTKQAVAAAALSKGIAGLEAKKGPR
jgi:hypothetical protein